MTAQQTKENTLSVLLITRWEEIGKKLASLAGEFPKEKFEDHPVDAVRTFGETLRHIAFWNHYLAETLRGKEADGNANELPHADYRTKPGIVEALDLTSREVADELKKRSGDLDLKSAEQVLAFIEHNCEHYGQLVVYSRLAGVIPPASR